MRRRYLPAEVDYIELALGQGDAAMIEPGAEIIACEGVSRADGAIFVVRLWPGPKREVPIMVNGVCKPANPVTREMGTKYFGG